MLYCAALLPVTLAAGALRRPAPSISAGALALGLVFLGGSVRFARTPRRSPRRGGSSSSRSSICRPLLGLDGVRPMSAIGRASRTGRIAAVCSSWSWPASSSARSCSSCRGRCTRSSCDGGDPADDGRRAPHKSTRTTWRSSGGWPASRSSRSRYSSILPHRQKVAADRRARRASRRSRRRSSRSTSCT